MKIKQKLPIIAQIVPELDRGGVERGTIEMAEAIKRKGWKSIVISNGGNMVGHLKRLGVEHYDIQVNNKIIFKWPIIKKQLKNIFLDEDINIVHVRSRVPAWLALSIAKKLNIKTVSTIHSRFKPKNFLKYFYNKKMLNADQIIAISQYIKDTILSDYKIRNIEKKLSVIYRGVDLNIFNNSSVSQYRIIQEAERISLPYDKKIIMLPARATSWKGHKILIDAVAKIRNRDFILVLLGASDGSKNFVDDLHNHCRQNSLEQNVRIVSWSNDMPASLMLADVVVMPSIVPEPFGRISVEAQSMGRPIVAFNHGGAKETILNNATGWLAEEINSISLSENIQKALAMNEKERKAFAQRTRVHIKNNFSKEQMCNQTLEIYKNLISA